MLQVLHHNIRSSNGAARAPTSPLPDPGTVDGSRDRDREARGGRARRRRTIGDAGDRRSLRAIGQTRCGADGGDNHGRGAGHLHGHLSSAKGNWWLLISSHETRRRFVRREPNPASGEQAAETRSRKFSRCGPEYAALWRIIGSSEGGGDGDLQRPKAIHKAPAARCRSIG
jgi:hypothetical protein